MVTRRTAKSKGAQFEYDTQHSLNEKGFDFYRTAERGFQQQYDLRDDVNKVVVECKFLKTITWNQAKKFFLKLKSKAPEGYKPILVYKTNQQPVLCMVQGKRDNGNNIINLFEFEEVFGKFKKHPSTRVRK